MRGCHPRESPLFGSNDMTDDPKPAPEEPGIFKRSRSLIAVAVAIAAFVAGTLYDLLPNLVPVTERTAEVTIVSAEPAVTQEQFGEHTVVGPGNGTEFHCGQQPDRPPPRPEGSEAGFVIHFAFTVAGLRGDCLLTEYVLFDGDTGRRLDIARPQFQQDWSTDLRETDAGSGEMWVSESDLDNLTTGVLVVRVELYNDAFQRLTYSDTPRLCLPALRPCEETAPASS